MQCPKCQQDVEPNPVGFTWWGGLIGSKIIPPCSSWTRCFRGRFTHAHPTCRSHPMGAARHRSV